MQDAVARNTAVKAAVKAVWPPVEPAKLVLRLLTDADFLAAHADGILDEEEQKTILWALPGSGKRAVRSVKAAKWAAADAVLIDEATDLVQRTHSLGHVVLDEAQDLSPCSTARSAAAAPPVPRPSSATSRRAPRPGRRGVGTRRWPTSASRRA